MLRRIASSLALPDLREWPEKLPLALFPDRMFLVNQILPGLSEPGVTMLWVGCRRYTRRYPVIIERRGAICWTLEIDPAAQRWGHPSRHTVGDLQKVGGLYRPGQFEVALVNGVFGYGLNTLQGQNEAVAGLARILKPGGMLVLGWNTDRCADPCELPATAESFVRSPRLGFERRIVFSNVTHVYDFLMRRDLVNEGRDMQSWPPVE